MSLIEEARAMVGQNGTRCAIALLMDTLDTTGRAELQDALDSDVNAHALSRALKERKTPVPYETIKRHRRKECRCL